MSVDDDGYAPAAVRLIVLKPCGAKVPLKATVPSLPVVKAATVLVVLSFWTISRTLRKTFLAVVTLRLEFLFFIVLFIIVIGSVKTKMGVHQAGGTPPQAPGAHQK